MLRLLSAGDLALVLQRKRLEVASRSQNLDYWHLQQRLTDVRLAPLATAIPCSAAVRNVLRAHGCESKAAVRAAVVATGPHGNDVGKTGPRFQRGVASLSTAHQVQNEELRPDDSERDPNHADADPRQAVAFLRDEHRETAVGTVVAVQTHVETAVARLAIPFVG